MFQAVHRVHLEPEEHIAKRVANQPIRFSVYYDNSIPRCVLTCLRADYMYRTDDMYTTFAFCTCMTVNNIDFFPRLACHAGFQLVYGRGCRLVHGLHVK